ncbi:hypothetical protein ONE63_003497 [Megalurothrips usitatus]|uniref:Retrovirus-related Pol polyprotein from transposon TNT 1-94 n=1 Tax=Megalurothrips usitatus TaxID=439358 RepID=A0AAV7X738_9NEOP|nr:hypothetical protein ONE63_003497 [Megalurothrips usitatus]
MSSSLNLGLNRVVKNAGYGLELIDKQLAGVFLLGLPKQKYRVTISMLGKEPGERCNTQMVKSALLSEKDVEDSETNSGAFASSSRGGHSRGGGNRGRGGRGGFRGGGKDINANDTKASSQEFKCFNCNQSGHSKKFCPSIKCHKCNKLGHLAINCQGEVQNTENSDNLSNQKPKFRACVSSSKAMLSSGSQSGFCEFLVDSAATDHICNDRSLFSDLRASSGEITMGKGSVAVLGEGKIELQISDECGGWKLQVSHVLYAPDYNFNLLSTSKLAKKDIFCTSEREKLVARDAADNMEVVFTAPEIEGLYVLKVKVDNNNQRAKVGCASDVSVNEINVNNAVALRSAIEWHSKLGHLHEEAIKKIPVIDCHGKIDEKCDVCAKGKATRIGFPVKSERKSEKLLELIHTDVMGKLATSVRGSRYAVTFIDDYSRHVSVFYLSRKDQVFNVFKEYKTKVEVLHESRIKALQSDGGGEYMDAEFQRFLRENGIVQRRTVRDSPEQNGIAERQNRTLANAVRCMLIESGPPVSFWAEAMSVACYLRNLSPSRAINNRIPVVLWSNKEVRAETYKRLLPFGCKGWIYKKDGKFEQRAHDCVFVGYGDNMMGSSEVKGYRVWVPSVRKFIVAHDVKFDVKVFPYKIKNSKNVWTVPDVPIVPDNDNVIETCLYFEENLGEGEDDDMIENLQVAGEVYHGEENVILQDYAELNVEPEPEMEIVLPRRSERIIKQKMCILDCCKGENSNHTSLMSILRSAVCTCCCVSMFIEECDCVETMIMEPKNIYMALNGKYGDEWRSAMSEELLALEAKHVFEIVDRPKCVKVLSCKWVFKIKQHQDGSIERFRARLVARGFDQIKGVNYHKTDSPVIKKKTVRLLLAIAVQKNWVVHHLGVLSAYLNSPLEEEVYVEIPDGIESDRSKVWKLNKSLYGLKQSAREWHKRIDSMLRDLGLESLKKDRCLYVNKKKNLFVGLYVDDLGFWGELEEVEFVKRHLSSMIEVRDIGKMENFLSMHIVQENDCISIDQKKNTLKRLWMSFI